MHKKVNPWIFLSAFCAFLLFVKSAALTAHASETMEDTDSLYGIVYESDATGYRVLIEDDAYLLDDYEKAALLNDMKPITAYGNIAFKSTSYNSMSTSSYAADYYESVFGSQSGAVFLIDMDNREIYIYSDGSLHRTITNSTARIITDNVYTYASKEDYYSCVSTAFSQILAKLEGQRIAQPMKYITNGLFALLFSSLLNYFFVKAYSRAKKPTDEQLLEGIHTYCQVTDGQAVFTHQTRTYSPQSSGSSGGGGGGGGGHSGGGGGHSF